MSNPRAISEQNTKKIEEEISTLEIELKDAQKALELALLRVKTLTKTLEEKRASIAPVRLASFDILSLIFEWCGIADWRSPLRIGGVSRHWRSIVLNAPRAWIFIDTVDVDYRLCEIYFDRSKHCGLHVAADCFVGKKVADKIECLTMNNDPIYEDIPLFPQLKRFCYADNPELLADVTILSTSHFPLLRHLEIHCGIEFNVAFPELPPLESLIVSIHDDEGWPEIIQACKSSLISLKLNVYDCNDLELTHIELANLLYLQITSQVHIERSVSLDLTTPNLKTYMEERLRPEYSHVRCRIPESISHMRLEDSPLAAGLTQLRVLQLDVDHAHILEFCDGIKDDDRTYSSLETLEFRHPQGEDAHLGEGIDAALSAIDWSALIHLTHRPRLVEKWSRELPGEIGHLCGSGVPCAEWISL